MTSILFSTEAIYCNISRSNYLRNKNFFCIFFLHFLNLDSILNIFFQKKDEPHSWGIFELTDSEKRG